MEAVHLSFLAFSALVILVSDEHALAWLMGRTQTLAPDRMRLLHRLVWLGIAGLLVSGAVLLYPRADYLLFQPLFQIKLLFVGILVANAVLIGRLMPIASARPFAALSASERAPLLISAFLSSISWISAAAIGFYLFW